MDFQDYLRILNRHWKAIVAAAVVGALLGGLISVLNRPAPVAQDRAPFVATVNATLVSENGRRDLARRLSDLTAATTQAEIAIENPSADLSTADYARLLRSEETLAAAAQLTDQEPNTFDGRVTATANADVDAISLTVRGTTPESSVQEAEALVQASRDTVRQLGTSSASSQILITTQSPNPDLETNAGYTASRMPTYAALVTSDQVIDPAAAQLGISADDVRASLSRRIETDTTILVLSLDELPGNVIPDVALRAVADSLQSVIASIEDTSVDFQDLGPADRNSGTDVRLLTLTTSDPSVIANDDGSIPPATIASTLTALATETPASLSTDLTPITAPLTDAETADILTMSQVAGDAARVTVIPITQVEGIADNPVNPATIRITSRGTTPEQAAAVAESTIAKLNERLDAPGGSNSWPLTLVPSTLVVTSEIISTPAPAAEEPVDRTVTNIVLGLLIGLALGVGYAFLMSSRDKTIYGPRQLVEATGEPAFGVIPTSDLSTGWAALSEHDLGGEGYRALRSNVLLGLKDTTVLALVSPTSGTGTNTVGINLAISLAQSGSRVCVVETALSQPRLADLLDTHASPGLADVIAGSADLDASIQRVDALGFDAITAGETTNDVTDTLTSRALHTTIDQLRERYDTVMLLCAPAVESPEASAVAPLSDATLILIRVAATSMTDLEITARVLLQVNTKIAGIVANDVPHEHTDQWRRYLPMNSPQSDQVPN